MRRIPRGVIAALVVVVAVLGTLLTVYLTMLAPQLRERRKTRHALTEVQERFKQVQADFGYNPNPQAELDLLRQEIDALDVALKSMGKLGEATLPEPLMPPELDTPDDAQLLRRYRTHLEDLAEEIDTRVRDAYSQRRIIFDRSIVLDSEIRSTAEARFRKANLLVAEELSLMLLSADIFALRKLDAKPPVRRGDILQFTFDVEVEMAADNLVRFVYLLREQPAYYYLEDVDIRPVSDARGASYFEPRESLDIRMAATIGTVRSQTETETPEERREKAKQLAEQRQEQEAKKSSDPWAAMMRQLDDPTADKSQFGEKKPWWKFW